MQKARRHPISQAPTACRRTVSGTISLFYSKYFSPFPYGTGSLSVTWVVFSLTGWYRQIHTGFLWSRATQDTVRPTKFTPTGLSPISPLFPKCSVWFVFLKTVLQPRSCTQLRFGLVPVRSPLLGESFVIFFSSSYLDVSVQRVGFSFEIICLQHIRLSHSEIFGLTVVCTYPKLIAAYHVLHRRSVPRHPPYALISL